LSEIIVLYFLFIGFLFIGRQGALFMDNDLGPPIKPRRVRIAVVSHGIVLPIGFGFHELYRNTPTVHIGQHHFRPFTGQPVVVMVVANRISIPLDFHGKLVGASSQVADHLVDIAKGLGVQPVIIEFKIDHKTDDRPAIQAIHRVIIVLEIVHVEIVHPRRILRRPEPP